MDTVYRYDPTTNNYTTLAHALVATWNCGAILYLNGKIYKIGGLQNGGMATNAVEAYDIATNTWSMVASYPINIYWASVFTQNGFVYGVGGLDICCRNEDISL